MRWLVVILFLPVLAYGALNVLVPRTTLAWQVRSTARHDVRSPSATVGRAFQRWLRIDPADLPDSAVLNRMRAIGVVEIVVATSVIAVALAGSF